MSRAVLRKEPNEFFGRPNRDYGTSYRGPALQPAVSCCRSDSAESPWRGSLVLLTGTQRPGTGGGTESPRYTPQASALGAAPGPTEAKAPAFLLRSHLQPSVPSMNRVKRDVRQETRCLLGVRLSFQNGTNIGDGWPASRVAMRHLQCFSRWLSGGGLVNVQPRRLLVDDGARP